MAFRRAWPYHADMITLHEFMSADRLQKLLRINLAAVAFVTDEGTGVRLHFSALPGDFVDVIDFGGHLDA